MLVLVLQDSVQRGLGTKIANFAIIAGVIISVIFAPPALVLAVFTSGCVDLVIDSVVFIHVAFGNLEFIYGQIIGKTWVIIPSLPAMFCLRKCDKRLEIAPAKKLIITNFKMQAMTNFSLNAHPGVHIILHQQITDLLH